MSDYSDIARSYLGGAQLGIQQFNAIQNAQAEEEARRIQQEQFNQRHALDQQEFDLRRQQVLEQLGFQREDQDMQRQQFEWHQAQQAQEQENLAAFRDFAKGLALGAAGVPQTGFDTAGSQGTTPQPAQIGDPGWADQLAVGSYAGPFANANQQVQPIRGNLDPNTAELVKYISRADGEGLKAMLPYLDDQKKHQKLMTRMKALDEYIGQPGLIIDPSDRALLTMYRNANDPERYMVEANRAIEEARARRQLQAAGAPLGLNPDASVVLGNTGIRDVQVAHEKEAIQQQIQTAGSAALARLRNGQSKAEGTADADFAAARRAGLVNQEDVNISGKTRMSPEAIRAMRDNASQDVKDAEEEYKASFGVLAPPDSQTLNKAKGANPDASAVEQVQAWERVKQARKSFRDVNQSIIDGTAGKGANKPIPANVSQPRDEELRAVVRQLKAQGMSPDQIKAALAARGIQ